MSSAEAIAADALTTYGLTVPIFWVVVGLLFIAGMLLGAYIMSYIWAGEIEALKIILKRQDRQIRNMLEGTVDKKYGDPFRN